MTSRTQMTRVLRGEKSTRLERRRFTVKAKGAFRHTTSESVIVGSSTAADLRIDVPSVSRLHVRLESADSGVRIIDLNSTNGTFIAGVKVLDAVVENSVTVLLGDASVQIEIENTYDGTDLGNDTHFGELLGASEEMRFLFDRLRTFAQADSTVLLHGETGTGKELAAEAIHAASSRRNQPFVVVDCGSLPASLIEAELFGHEEGAFTGANRLRIGAFEAAHEGTLFLDEIGELDISLQPHLLRAVESGTIRRIGASKGHAFDVRLIAATHRDLAKQVSSGDFREDLFYRLNVLSAELPPLRKRRGDIALLARHFAELAALRFPTAKTAVLTEEFLESLGHRSWPGNARELRNFVERTVLLGPRARAAGDDGVDENNWQQLPLQDAREVVNSKFERDYIAAALARSNGNVAAAARAAGVHRGYLFRLIRRHGLRNKK